MPHFCTQFCSEVVVFLFCSIERQLKELQAKMGDSRERPPSPSECLQWFNIKAHNSFRPVNTGHQELLDFFGALVIKTHRWCWSYNYILNVSQMITKIIRNPPISSSVQLNVINLCPSPPPPPLLLHSEPVPWVWRRWERGGDTSTTARFVWPLRHLLSLYPLLFILPLLSECLLRPPGSSSQRWRSIRGNLLYN